MKTVNALRLGILLSLIGCVPKTRNTSANDLVGQWRNVYMQVTMPTYRNSDSTITTTCDSTNWEEMLHIKPIRTFFEADGTYRSEYYTLSDSLFRKVAGKWHISNDTLVMNENEGSVYRLKIALHNGLAEFDGRLDFDSDGKEDDHYVGRQRKY